LRKFVDFKLKETLKGKPFSFFIDGWTDQRQAHLTIGIRYFDPIKGLKVRLFDDISYIDDGTGKALYCYVR
jgi:hypothetical protein